MLKPNAIFEKITDINPEFLHKNKIEGLILDVDNTLIDLDRVELDGIKEWTDKIKKENIKVCIASNSIKKNKVQKIANKLDIPYIYFSTKPLKRGLKKAVRILQIKKENIAEIGDQLFTDVLGANRMKMFSILTTPISPEKHKLSMIKRKLETKILRKYKSEI